jgi:hypothetical protein
MKTGTFDPQLAEIVCAGAAMLDDVTDAVRHCRTDADPSSELAPACGSLTSRYLALLRRAQLLPASARQRRAYELLNYHMELTAPASMLAFRPHDEHWPALAEGFGDGPGQPSRDLQRLADEVRVARTSAGNRSTS